MGIFKGGALRLFQTFLYLIAFCCAGIILGVYSYFLAVNADRPKHYVVDNHLQHIPTWEKAVEGMSGIAVIYTVLAFFLTCCLGGITFFGIIGLILDVCFCGAMIAIAVLTRHGASSCKGIVNTPIGTGNANQDNGFGNDNAVYKVHLGLACRLNTAAFAVSIVGAIIFLITAAMQIVLMRSHKKESRFGPGPNNNYTSGSGRRWGRGRKNKGVSRDAEMGAAPVGAAGGLAPPAAVDNRASHETGYTGTTVGGAGAGAVPQDKVDGAGYTHAGYHTQPTGTGVTPYGYHNSGNASTNY